MVIAKIITVKEIIMFKKVPLGGKAAHLAIPRTAKPKSILLQDIDEDGLAHGSTVRIV